MRACVRQAPTGSRQAFDPSPSHKEQLQQPALANDATMAQAQAEHKVHVSRVCEEEPLPPSHKGVQARAPPTFQFFLGGCVGSIDINSIDDAFIHNGALACSSRAYPGAGSVRTSAASASHSACSHCTLSLSAALAYAAPSSDSNRVLMW